MTQEKEPRLCALIAGLGYLSSWPLFSLCHHFLVGCAAEDVYPGRRFLDYALLGDDIVIGYLRNKEWKEWLADLGVSVSKSLVSDIGEAPWNSLRNSVFVKGIDLSPINIQMKRAATHAVGSVSYVAEATMPL